MRPPFHAVADSCSLQAPKRDGARRPHGARQRPLALTQTHPSPPRPQARVPPCVTRRPHPPPPYADNFFAPPLFPSPSRWRRSARPSATRRPTTPPTTPTTPSSSSAATTPTPTSAGARVCSTGGKQAGACMCFRGLPKGAVTAARVYQAAAGVVLRRVRAAASIADTARTPAHLAVPLPPRTQRVRRLSSSPFPACGSTCQLV